MDGRVPDGIRSNRSGKTTASSDATEGFFFDPSNTRYRVIVAGITPRFRPSPTPQFGLGAPEGIFGLEGPESMAAEDEGETVVMQIFWMLALAAAEGFLCLRSGSQHVWRG